MDRETQPSLAPPALFRIAWVFYLLLATAAIVWIGWRLGRIPLALFVDPEALALDLGAGLLAAAFLLAVWELTRRLLPAAARQLEDVLAPLVAGFDAGEIAALAVLSGVAEELFFRGAVQGAWGLTLATLLFAMLHLGPGTRLSLWTAFAAVAGLVFGGLVLWRGTLLAPIVAHTALNGVNLYRLASRAPVDDEGSAASTERDE